MKEGEILEKRRFLKNPNGQGSVYKLSGRRRKPWVVRKTIGFENVISKDGKPYAKPKYEYLGYFETRTDALNFLGQYNLTPQNQEYPKMIYQDVFEEWFPSIEENFSESTIFSYKSAYDDCFRIHNKMISDITLKDFENAIELSNKNIQYKKKIKGMNEKLFKYAYKHGYLPYESSLIPTFIDVEHIKGEVKSRPHSRFTDEEIEVLWKQDDWLSEVVLILIYSGVRIGELLKLKNKNVHIDDKYFFVDDSKTPSGVREVPIHDKIIPFFKKYSLDGNEYFLTNRLGNHFQYHSFLVDHWYKSFNKSHTPHDTRHTTVSKLVEVGVDDRIIKSIVGHKGGDVTQDVYTHIKLETKLQAINKI